MQNSNWFRKLFAKSGSLLPRNLQARTPVPAAKEDGARNDPSHREKSGEAYQQAGQYREAETSFLQLLAIEKKQPPNAGWVNAKPHAISRAETLLLNLYIQSKQHDKAKSLCSEIQERYRAAEDQIGLMWFLDARVVPLYRQIGLLEEAVSLQLQVVAWEQPRAEEKYSSYAQCLTNLAQLYEEMGQYADALAYYQTVLDIREQDYDPNHRVCIDSFEAGVGMSYNPSEMNRLQAHADVSRCISKLIGPPPTTPPSL